MKKIICLLAVVAMTAPLFAQNVDFTVSRIGDDQVQISYTTTQDEPNRPICHALEVAVTNGTVTGLVSTSSNYTVYLDYMKANPAPPYTYPPLTPPAGAHPLAELYPSAMPALPAASVVVNMCDLSGNAVAGDTICVLQLKCNPGGDMTVDVAEENTYRGGVVNNGVTPIVTDLPINGTTICVYDTFAATADLTSVGFGPPDCTVDVDDWSYMSFYYNAGDCGTDTFCQAADFTSPGFGAPDNKVDVDDWSYMSFYYGTECCHN